MKQIVVSAQINKSAAPANSAPFKPFNGVVLVGDLTEKADGQFVIETKNIGYKRGSTEPVEFVEEHPVMGNADAFEIGKRVMVTGYIGRVPRGTQMIHRLVAAQVIDAENKPYQNVAKIAGRAMGNVHKRDRNSTTGAEAFGRMFVDTAIEGGSTNGVRITLFGDMLANWSQRVYPNRQVTVFGYLNNRSRWDADGNKDVITEIRANEAKSQLHGADQADPFAAFQDDSAFAPAAAMAFTAPEPAQAEPAPTGKSGKSKKGSKANKPADAQGPTNLF